MEPAALTTAIASQGLLGVLLVIVGWVAWAKDRELQAERAARISDAQTYTEMALKLQAQVIDAVNKLADILEEIRRIPAPPPPGRSTLGGGR